MNAFVELGAIFFGASILAGLVGLIASRSSDQLTRWQAQIPARAFDFAAWGTTGFFFIVWAVLNLRRYEAFQIYGFDFAVFNQTIANTLRGHVFENTIIPDSPVLLGQRFSPILFALVPLYALALDPRWLVVLPAFTAAFAAIPLYWFARKRVGRALALVAVLVFLVSPATQFAALDQFYEILIALPLFMLGMAFLLERRYVPFSVCLGLTLLCKEEVGFIAIALGAFIFLIQRRVWGMGLMVASGAWVALVLQVILPAFHGDATYYYFDTRVTTGPSQYAYLGRSLGEIAITIFTQPMLVLEHFVTPPKMLALLLFVVPLGLMPIVGGEVAWLALPTLAYTLLSDLDGHYRFGLHHYAPVIAIMMMSFVVGLRRMTGTSNVQKWALGVGVLTCSVTSYFWFAPGPLTRSWDSTRYTLDAHTQIGNELLATIPANAPVLMQMELASHLTTRRDAYIMTAIPCRGLAEYAIANMRQPWFTYRRESWDALTQSQLFSLTLERDGWLVFQRNAPKNPARHSFDDELTWLGSTMPVSDLLSGNLTIQPILTWRFERATTMPRTVRVSVTDAQAHVWAETRQPLCGGLPAVKSWARDTVIAEAVPVRLPPTMPTSVYYLQVSVGDSPDIVEATTFQVNKNKNSFTASDLQIPQPLFVDMAEMRFLGFEPMPALIAPGELMQIGLYWRARVKPQSDYLAIVQLRDVSGRIAFEQSARPANGVHPTRAWNAGEVLLDWHDFNIPSDLAPGAYDLVALLRDASTTRVVGEARLATIQVRQ